jgi:hypothetical protein
MSLSSKIILMMIDSQSFISPIVDDFLGATGALLGNKKMCSEGVFDLGSRRVLSHC